MHIVIYRPTVLGFNKTFVTLSKVRKCTFVINKRCLALYEVHMEQSISFKIGKGSIAHNARDFTASNVDSNRSQYNIEYVNKDLKQTYHELFDDAVTKYNAR